MTAVTSALASPVPPRSQTSAAYLQLRTEIISGNHAPGVRLKGAEISQRLKVSPGAVREALSRLVSERLVISRDQRGFIVAPVSLQDLEQLTDLRCEIEAIALRRSVERGGVEWEANIIACAHRLNATEKLIRNNPPTLNPEWIARHSAYHASLVAACGNPRLVELHYQLSEQADRYRGLSIAREASARSVANEHDKIMKAALTRNANALVKAVVDHIRLTTQLIVQGAEGRSRTARARTARVRTG